MEMVHFHLNVKLSPLVEFKTPLTNRRKVWGSPHLPVEGKGGVHPTEPLKLAPWGWVGVSELRTNCFNRH